MHQNTHLFNLYSIFSLYAPCWQDWKAYPHNGLDATDLYVLENLQRSNFNIEAGNGQMFYYQPKVIEGVTAKLHSNYPHYQEWVIIKFWFALIRRLDKHLLEQYFGTPFDELPLSPGEKELLKKFGVGSLNQLIQKYTDADLRQSPLFGLVLQLCAIYSPSKTIAA